MDSVYRPKYGSMSLLNTQIYCGCSYTYIVLTGLLNLSKKPVRNNQNERTNRFVIITYRWKYNKINTYFQFYPPMKI